jgi:hypothetical protein
MPTRAAPRGLYPRKPPDGNSSSPYRERPATVVATFDHADDTAHIIASAEPPARQFALDRFATNALVASRVSLSSTWRE